LADQSTRAERSAGRRLLFGTILVGVTALTIEAISFGFYFAVAGRVFHYDDLRDARLAVSETAGERTRSEARVPTWVVNKALHPYVGYVIDQTGADGRPLRGVSSFGYLDDAPPLRQRSPERLLLGIVGGSVAMGFAASPTVDRVLRERLAAAPAFAGLELEFVRLAVSGYHEPQQLMTLSYLLALGGELDVLINIDGFNEVALHPAENARLGVFPAYPRAWYLHTANLPLRLTASYSYALERQRRFAAPFLGVLGHSVTANLVWLLCNRRLASDVEEAREALLAAREGPADFASTGPPRHYADADAMAADLVDLWRRSSLQLDLLSRANGIRYLHFLQPSQYFPGSKPLSAAERAQAFDPDKPFRDAVERGYPLLREAGRDLVAQGLEFTDLSALFAGVEEPLYIDTCCHFDERGYEMVAEAVARVLVRSQ
jgi:hypothetical protein